MPFIKGHSGYKFWLGKHLSKKHRKKLSKAHKGKRLSKETKRKIGLKSLGHKVNKEAREKIGNANRGKKSGSWKGNKVKYRGLHSWIVKNWGKADICENCGSVKYIDWHNKDGKYNREDKNNWEQLCRRCHMLKDGRIKNGFKFFRKKV